MMWSDKAFNIYMGSAGTDTQFDANPHAVDSVDVLVHRMDVPVDGDTRSGWRSQAGTSLTDTQVHSAARG